MRACRVRWQHQSTVSTVLFAKELVGKQRWQVVLPALVTALLLQFQVMVGCHDPGSLVAAAVVVCHFCHTCVTTARQPMVVWQRRLPAGHACSQGATAKPSS